MRLCDGGCRKKVVMQQLFLLTNQLLLDSSAPCVDDVVAGLVVFLFSGMSVTSVVNT